MEKMKVFARQHMDFTTKEGKRIQGVKLHCLKPVPNQYWEGAGYESLFFPSTSPLIGLVDTLSIGSEVEVEFNRYGKPADLVISE